MWIEWVKWTKGQSERDIVKQCQWTWMRVALEHIEALYINWVQSGNEYINECQMSEEYSVSHSKLWLEKIDPSMINNKKVEWGSMQNL